MFDLPESTLFNRKIPKSKFYERTKANTKLKELFTRQIDVIIWKHKLSKDTINLEPTDEIQEIQVFEVFLKERELSREVLRSIDKVIPFPVRHVLVYEDEAKLPIAYKERNQHDENVCVIHAYYESDWQPKSECSFPLVKGGNFQAVYEGIIKTLIPYDVPDDEDLQVTVERVATIEKLQKECAALQSKIRREKQFNRKVELNIELQRKKKELGQLLKH